MNDGASRRSIVAAVDKFRGTATASDVAATIVAVCRSLGHDGIALPLADGGEGMLDAFGGPNRSTTVTGPLGAPVAAAWRLDRGTAVIEMARASGIALVADAAHADPLGATTAGTGELVLAAIEHGAERIIVGLGGSATTDGGRGAIEAIGRASDLEGIELLVACDVTTPFTLAAEVYGPQKGATAEHVAALSRRLERLAEHYRDRYGVDVEAMPGSGAAGGLAGGLAALGARLVSGFDLVARERGLGDALDGADLVITGEGCLDRQSFHGKVVGGVVRDAAIHSIPVVAIAGAIDPDVSHRVGAHGLTAAYSLSEVFGPERALGNTLSCIARIAESVLRDHLAEPGRRSSDADDASVGPRQ